jgi:hypothetical protein
MLIELERALVQEFPATYAALSAHVGAPMPGHVYYTSCPVVSVGVEHDNGWFGIARAFAHAVEAECAASDTYVCTEKQKFGELRIQLPTRADDVKAAIRDARAASVTICERCGAPGELQRSPRGSWATLCRDCRGSVGSYFCRHVAVQRFIHFVVLRWRPDEAALWERLLTGRIESHVNGTVQLW